MDSCWQQLNGSFELWSLASQGKTKMLHLAALVATLLQTLRLWPGCALVTKVKVP